MEVKTRIPAFLELLLTILFSLLIYIPFPPTPCPPGIQSFHTHGRFVPRRFVPRYTLPAEYQVVYSLQGSVFTDSFNPDPAMLSASSLGKGRGDAYQSFRTHGCSVPRQFVPTFSWFVPNTLVDSYPTNTHVKFF